MRHRSWRTAVAAICTAVAVWTTTAAAHPAPADRAPTRAGQRTAGDRTFSTTSVTRATRTTLRFTLDAGPGGRLRPLSPAVRARIADLLGKPVSAVRSSAATRAASTNTAATATATSAAAKGPAVLRCDKNPSWSDVRGTLHARFNCHKSTINWGYQVSRQVQAIITGPVREVGVSWWRNGKSQPRNAGHTVVASYLMHGTLNPVNHGDHVQFQDYMTFRVNFGGQTGTGSLAWASDVMAKK